MPKILKVMGPEHREGCRERENLVMPKDPVADDITDITHGRNYSTLRSSCHVLGSCGVQIFYDWIAQHTPVSILHAARYNPTIAH